MFKIKCYFPRNYHGRTCDGDINKDDDKNNDDNDVKVMRMITIFKRGGAWDRHGKEFKTCFGASSRNTVFFRFRGSFSSG